MRKQGLKAAQLPYAKPENLTNEEVLNFTLYHDIFPGTKNYRPVGVVAGTLASHADDKGSILVRSLGRSLNHGVNGRGSYQCFESNTSAWRVGVAPPYICCSGIAAPKGPWPERKRKGNMHLDH